MRTILKITFISILLAGVFQACKKSSSSSKSKTELITQTTWKFSAATANGNDASNYIDACQKDNIYTFVSTGTGNVDEGATKCDPGDPQTIPFNWNFASNETVLHLSTTFFSGAANDLTITTLTETQLIVSFPYTPPVGPTIQMKVTFVH